MQQAVVAGMRQTMVRAYEHLLQEIRVGLTQSKGVFALESFTIILQINFKITTSQSYFMSQNPTLFIFMPTS